MAMPCTCTPSMYLHKRAPIACGLGEGSPAATGNIRSGLPASAGSSAGSPSAKGSKNTNKARTRKVNGSASTTQRAGNIRSSVPVDSQGLQILTLNVNGWSAYKWKQIQNMPGFNSIDVVIVTEHHRHASFRPEEIINETNSPRIRRFRG